MNKKEFLTELEDHLMGVSKEDRKEIMQDYEEHFKIGKKKKRSEAEISRSLGNPKQIAREVRSQLYSSEKTELKSEAIETWVAVKKFSVSLFNETKDKIRDAIYKDKKKSKKHDKTAKIILIGLIILALILIFKGEFLSLIVLGVIGYFVFKFISDRKSKYVSAREKRTKKKISKDKSTLKIVLSIMFNILIFVWVWISLLMVIFSLFICSFAVIITGALLIASSVFALITQSNPLTKDILFSGLFAGAGILVIGSLFIDLSQWLITLFFKLTKKYIELNNRFIRK